MRQNRRRLEETTVTEQETAEKASVTETSEQKTAEEASRDRSGRTGKKEKRRDFSRDGRERNTRKNLAKKEADIEEKQKK